MLVSWIEQTDAALTALVGKLPFTKHIYFHRLEQAREPVPWAHTQRRPNQGVHFHVDPTYPLAEFTADWTAPHELSHLVLPYLGERHAWFAEGFASFMQYQIMAQMGIVDERDLRKQYLERFSKAESSFDIPDLPFAEAARELRAQRRFPIMYWGGAVYFWQMDRWLAAHTQSGLNSTLRAYVSCCRARTRHLRQLMESLDGITNDAVFSAYFTSFRSRPGFPEYRKMPDLKPRSG